jgi:hypothetical protein
MPGEPTFSDLVDELEGRVDGTVDSVFRRMQEHHPEWVGGDPGSEEQLRAYSRQSILTEYRWLRDGDLPETCPPGDAEGARVLARLGLPVQWLLTGFRVGHRCHWEAWLDLTEQRVGDADVRRGLLDRASQFMFDYVERLTLLITEEYESERRRVSLKQAPRLALLVHQLVNGAELDSEALGWPLEHRHLGLLGWEPGGEAALRELAAEVDRPLLTVEGGVEGVWFGWISGASPLSRADHRRISGFRPAAGRIAVGLEAEGSEGFRLTNRQARRASWVALHNDAPVTRFNDVAVEGLAMADADSAKSFVARELRGLDDESSRGRRMRETLLAYFEADHNAAAAAAALGVHQQTVANRIRAAEDTLGAPVSRRRAELETALRLRRCFEKPPSLEAGLQNAGYLP